MVTSDHVDWVAAECTAFLRSVADRNWGTEVLHLEWTVAEVVAHMAETCLWYAVDLAAGGPDLAIVEHRVEPEAAPELLVDTLATFARITAAVIDASPDDARGYHPYGPADPSGFAAMTCDELLVHTSDVGRGLEEPFAPSPDLPAAVVARLFPWAPEGIEPWDVLLWANGRTELRGHGRLTEWRWHSRPLSEWDGTVPA